MRKLTLFSPSGDVSLVTCTLLALTKATFEFRDVLPDAVVDSVVTNVCKLAAVSAREVAGSALSFLKAFVTVSSNFRVFRGGRLKV